MTAISERELLADEAAKIMAVIRSRLKFYEDNKADLTREGQHGALVLSNLENDLLKMLAATRASADAPVAWIDYADNGNIRFWTSDKNRADLEKAKGRHLRGFTLAELVALRHRRGDAISRPQRGEESSALGEAS